MQPPKEMEVIKEALTDIKGNLKEQAKDWKDKWHVTVKIDQKPTAYQKLKFEFKAEDKPQIDLKHSAYYTITWIAYVNNQCGMHKTPKKRMASFHKRPIGIQVKKSSKMPILCIDGIQQ